MRLSFAFFLYNNDTLRMLYLSLWIVCMLCLSRSTWLSPVECYLVTLFVFGSVCGQTTNHHSKIVSIILIARVLSCFVKWHNKRINQIYNDGVSHINTNCVCVCASSFIRIFTVYARHLLRRSELSTWLTHKLCML